MQQTLKMATAALVLTSVISTAAVAQTTITEHTSGAAGETLAGVGQSLTVPGTGGWSSLSFSFFRDGGVASAAGSLYLLSSEYLGTPAGLSAAVSGYVAQSTSIVDGTYFFAPSVSIFGGSQYFLYTDEEIFVDGSNTDTYAGGSVYGSMGGNYSAFTQGDANFNLSGTAIAVPEPGTFLLSASGLLLLFGVSRRRRRTVTAPAY